MCAKSHTRVTLLVGDNFGMWSDHLFTILDDTEDLHIQKGM
jgi:hypothetical protein